MEFFNISRNRREMVYAEYHAGPADCSGFQYEIVLPHPDAAEYQAARHAAVRKILNFAHHNTELTNESPAEE